jgi:uracil-DNA glycosylase
VRVKPTGPASASICLVGEAPGQEEEAKGLPFIGKSGYMLDQMLRDAGIMREACFITNVTHERPPNNDLTLWISEKAKAPDASFVNYRGRWVKPFIKEEVERLHAEIRSVQPNVVVALGNTPLWALCSERGVAKWRGSHLTSDAIPGLKVIPTYHPAAILRQFSWKWITTQDLRRAKGESISPLSTSPERSFGIKPSHEDAKSWLQALLHQLDKGPVPFTCDLEIYRKEILCVGIGLSSTTAFCLPFLWTQGWYYTPEQHSAIVLLLRKVLTHPNAQVINQNLSFDIQYLFWRFFIRPKAHFDTMIAQNVLFAGLPKDLAFLASMWCDHYIYWKDDGKFWKKYVEDELIWKYNCLDCCYTFEVYEKQQAALEKLKLTDQMAFQMRTFENLMGMMLRGVKVDTKQKFETLEELNVLIDSLHEDVKYLVGHSLTGEKGDFSSKQMADFFYKEMKFPPIYNKEHGLTCDDEALKRLTKKNLWIKPLVDRINMIRSYGTAVDVCLKRVDMDHRWRTDYGVAGTTSYRLSSRENPFDSGLNLQNLTTGRDIL